jgi:4-amino-4-deoxy-L-arabinose transferase-like glycosyltransferase
MRCLHHCLLFCILIAIVSYLLFYKLLYSIFGEGKIPLLVGAFLVLHPYMIGLSVFVFTDMFAILFLLISCISIIRHREVMLAVSLSCGLLCRQYMIFFVLAVGLYYLFRCHMQEGYDRDASVMLLSSFFSLIPLAILFFLWKGVSPDNQLRYLYLKEEYSFHPSFLTLYVCLFFVYLLPIIVVCWKGIYKGAKVC